MSIFDVLCYDPLTGVFTWAVDVSSRCKKGMVTGTLGDDGYLRIGYKGRYYKAHRLAWEIHNGPIPKGFIIDHDDRVRDNNKLSNLRLATRSQNNQNSPDRKKAGGLPRNIRTRAKGYQVRMKFNGKWVILGTFLDLELAELIENEARAKYHGEFAYDI